MSNGIAGLAAAGSSRHRQKISAIPAIASILPRSWHWAAPPTVAAQTRIVSKARIRLDSRKSVRSFKGIICVDISEFESYMPSHAVRSLCALNRRHRGQGAMHRRRFHSPLMASDFARWQPDRDAGCVHHGPSSVDHSAGGSVRSPSNRLRRVSTTPGRSRVP